MGMVRARLDSERACWAILVAAMALSAATILWFTRGTSFFSDEFTCFVASRGFDVKALLSPHNGHLFLGLRVVYAALFDLFGADYLVLRLLQAVGWRWWRGCSSSSRSEGWSPRSLSPPRSSSSSSARRRTRR